MLGLELGSSCKDLGSGGLGACGRAGFRVKKPLARWLLTLELQLQESGYPKS